MTRSFVAGAVVLAVALSGCGGDTATRKAELGEFASIVKTGNGIAVIEAPTSRGVAVCVVVSQNLWGWDQLTAGVAMSCDWPVAEGEEVRP